MSRLPRILAVIVSLGVCLAASARADGRRVTLPCGLYTLPDLARGLSDGEHRVRCSVQLANRAALVSLRSRSWDSAARTLEAGLSVRVRERGDREWTLEPDPEVERREAEWRSRFAALLQRRLEAEQDDLHRRFLSGSWRDLRTRTEQLTERWSQEAEAEQRDENDTGWLFISPYSPTVRELMRAQSLLTAAGWLTAPRLGQPGLGEALVRSPWLLSRMPSSGVTAAAVPEAALSFGDAPWEGPTAHDEPLHAVWLDPWEQRVLAQFWLCAPYAAKECGSAPFVAAALGLSETELFEALGADAVRWRRDAVRATRDLLASDDAQAPIRLSRREQDGSLSRIVEAWARQTDSEVVMELWPGRETSTWIDGRTSLAQRLEREPAAHCYLGLLSLWMTLPSEAEAVRLAKLVREDVSPWSLGRRDEVVMVTNRMAFLDRMRPAPLAALVALDREAVETPGPRGVRFEAVTRYETAAGRLGGSWWGLPNATYRDLPVAALERLGPFLPILDRVPLSQRALAWRRMQRGEPFLVPVGSLSPAERTRFIAACRALGIQAPVGQNSRFPEAALGANVVFTLTPSREPRPATYSLQAVLEDPSWLGTRDPRSVGPGAGLPIIPLDDHGTLEGLLPPGTSAVR
jgi:hypothetical protein